MANPSRKRTNQNPLYRVWYSMKRRCQETGTKDSHRYVDRGISYCDRWKNFDLFFEDMGSGYTPGLSLDRIDNEKGYFPENCRWATPKEQSNNRVTNKLLTIKDITKTLAQWIDESGLKSSTVRQRFYVYGWPLEAALSRKKEGK